MRRQLVSAFVLVYWLITDVYVWLLFKKKKKKKHDSTSCVSVSGLL